MSIAIVYNGNTYEIPSTGDVGWATSLNAYLIALSQGSSVGITIGAPPNGLSLAGSVLSLAEASASDPGVVSTTNQSFAGNKTFEGVIAGQLTMPNYQINGVNFFTDNWLMTDDGGWLFNANGSQLRVVQTQALSNSLTSANTGAGAAANLLGTEIADASVNATADLLRVAAGITHTEVPYLQVRKSGTLVPSVGIPTKGDSSHSPGNATLNTGAGFSAFASGTSTVIITNSLSTVTSVCVATFIDLDGTLTRMAALTRNGNIVFNGNANATSTTAFQWVLIV